MSKKTVAPKKTGRPAIFRPKDRLHGIRAFMTADGEAALQVARVRLATLTGWDADEISVGDVVEYLARGEKDTRAYLRRSGQLAGT